MELFLLPLLLIEILTHRQLLPFLRSKAGPLYKFQTCTSTLRSCFSSLKIRILSLRCGGSDNRFTFETIAIIDSPFRPVALQGDILAFSDSIADTVIWNWRNQRRAILRHAADKLLLVRTCIFYLCCLADTEWRSAG